MRHLALSPQDRSQLNQGRWFGTGAPLCNTGDGHHKAVGPLSEYKPWARVMVLTKVTCPACLKQLQDNTVRSTLGLERISA